MSENALLTESALLGPNNPTNAGGGDQDKQGEVLVIPAKREVGEKMINEIGITVRSGLPSARRKMAYKPVGGKKRAPPGAVAKRMAAMAAKEEETKESVITEDPPQLKNPPKSGMLLQVLPVGLDPVVVIPPSTETEHESTETTITPESQLAIAVSSKRS